MATYPTWSPTRILRAEELRGMQPQVIDAAVTFSSSTNTGVGHTDPELFFYAEPNAKYIVELYAMLNITAANTISINWAIPDTASTLQMSWSSTSNPTTMIARTKTRVNVEAYNTVGSTAVHSVEETTDLLVWDKFALTMGAVGNTITVDYNPITIQAGTLNRDLYSFLRVTRYA